MLRRAASGHIEATQLSKFAAASRIADAVISGCPEAPSSPGQGNGALPRVGAGCTCADLLGSGIDGEASPAFDGEPLNKLSRKLSGPSPAADRVFAPLHI